MTETDDLKVSVKVDTWIMWLMSTLYSYVDTEIGGWLFGKVEREGNTYTFYIEDIVIPKQRRTRGSVDYEQPYSLAEKISNVTEMAFLGTFHTHPNMSPHESWGDDKNLEKLANSMINTYLGREIIKMIEIPKKESIKADVYTVGPDLEPKNIEINPSKSLEEILEKLKNCLGKIEYTLYIESQTGRKVCGFKIPNKGILSINIDKEVIKYFGEKTGLLKEEEDYEKVKNILSYIVEEYLRGQSLEIKWKEKYPEPVYGIFVILGGFSTPSGWIGVYRRGGVRSLINFYIVKITRDSQGSPLVKKLGDTEYSIQIILEKWEKDFLKLDFEKVARAILNEIRKADYILVSEYLKRNKRKFLRGGWRV